MTPKEENTPSPDSGKWVFEEGYTYNPDSDTYIFFLRSQPKNAVPMPGSKIRRICESYSNFNGKGATINQIALAESIPRAEIIEILKHLGKTHDSDPYTPEIMENIDEDTLVTDSLQKKRRRYHIKLQEKSWKQTQQDADKWQEAEHFVTLLTEGLIERMPTLEDTCCPVGNTVIENVLRHQAERGCVIANIQDLHIGKAAALGDIELQEYINSIVKEFELGLIKLASTDHIEEVVFTLGGDVSDIDSSKGEISSGRRMLGNVVPEKIAYESLALLIRLVNIALQLKKPIHLYYVQGNHDKLMGWVIALAVMAYFRNNPLVKSTTSWHPRQYHRYEDHLFMLTHQLAGDVLKEVGATFMAEASSLVGQTRFRHVYTGHLHHETVSEDAQGVVRRQAPAPIYNDDYHLHYWPNARRQIQLVLHRPGSCTESVENRDVGQHYSVSPTTTSPLFLSQINQPDSGVSA